jgi:hypothetical protein
MESNNHILLLTASIDPAVSNTPFTVLKDPALRWKQYDANLMAILKLNLFGKIIFCENTFYQVDYMSWQIAAEKYGIELEILRFEGNKSCIEKQGKGYGEGEIIDYALRHSKWLNDQVAFYKLTGRIQVKNLKHIVKRHERDDVLFIRAQRNKEIVDTRLFKCTVDFYTNYLHCAYTEVNDHSGDYLEKIFFKRLKKVNNISPFRVFPRFSGVSGSTKDIYDLPVKEFMKYSILLKTGFLTI